LQIDGERNRAWKNIKESIQTSAVENLGSYVSKQHNPWFNEKYLSFLNRRKQAKLQLMQDSRQSNAENLNKVSGMQVDISGTKEGLNEF
jgi:tRNA A22 N-methylase